MYLHNDFTHYARRGWRLGTEVKVLKFESAMMCTNNVVFMNPRIMDVVFVISLTHKHFIDTQTLYWTHKHFIDTSSRVSFTSLFFLYLIFLVMARLLALMFV